jgi:formylglycine-generating enzyme required for sulfatase activity/tRNA A-37 threonylcarbamoyl transferase component Bud32
MKFEIGYNPEQLQPIVFRIKYSDEEHGSGFFVSTDGWALSCWHVVPVECVSNPSLPVAVEWPCRPDVSLRAFFKKDLSNRDTDIAVLKFDPLPDGQQFPTQSLVALFPPQLRNIGVCAYGFQETDISPIGIEIYGRTFPHNPVRPTRFGTCDEQWLLWIDPEGRNVEQGASGGPIAETANGNLIAIVTAHQSRLRGGEVTLELEVEPKSGKFSVKGCSYESYRYHPQGFGIPFYEVFENWPQFEQFCPVVVTDRATAITFPSIDTYEALEWLGSGGFATVYKGRRRDTGHYVAIKKFDGRAFRPDQQRHARAKFLRGGKIMKRLEHPNVARVLEVDEDENIIVMEYVCGGNLSEFLERCGRQERILDFTSKVRLAIQLTEALAYAHDRGVLHRDVAATNILVDDSDPASPRLLLTDFDLAYQRGRTQITGREWNWRHLLPRDLRIEIERLETDIDSISRLEISRPGIQSDLYFLGLVLVYLFGSFQPGPDEIATELDRLIQTGKKERWCSEAHLEHLVKVLERALRRRAEQRFVDAGQLLKELNYLLPMSEISDGETVRLAGGPFFMGSADAKFSEEGPRHLVRISPFQIDLYPVTNTQFKQFLDHEENAGWRRGGSLASRYATTDYLKHWASDDYAPEKENHPVVYISWYAAQAYAEWAGKRLPTEAEWEFAARAGKDGNYWWGDKPDTTKANYFSTRSEGTTAVGDFDPNPFGLYDMLGNVAEWCSDWYGRDYYQSPANDQDPRGPLDGIQKVCRGGSFESTQEEIRCASREKAGPKSCKLWIGFRCCRSEFENE